MIIYSGVVIGLPPFSQCNRPRCSKILAACCCPPRWGRPKIRLFIFTFHIQPTRSSTKANTSTDKIRIHIQADGQSASQADSHAVRRTDRQPARQTYMLDHVGIFGFILHKLIYDDITYVHTVEYEVRHSIPQSGSAWHTDVRLRSQGERSRGEEEFLGDNSEE